MPIPTPIPLTGGQYDLTAGEYRATVTALGAGLRTLTFRDQPLITGYGPDELPPDGAGQLLAPWPNRVDGGCYSFGGQQFQLELSEPAHGNAIHGLTRWAGWQADGQEATRVRLRHRLFPRPGYPFLLDLTARYELGPGGLTVQVTATNAGGHPAPYGTGHHPYLTAGPGPVDGWELTLPAASYLPSGPRGIPAGPPQDVAGTDFDFRTASPLGRTSLDHALTGLTRDDDGLAWTRLRAGDTEVLLWAGPGYDWLQVFTGDGLEPGQRRQALAVEPMTCPPNALASGDDLVVLEPGASVTHHWGIQARQA
jgi:aldose 1-epimerase